MPTTNAPSSVSDPANATVAKPAPESNFSANVPRSWFREELTPFDVYYHGVRETLIAKQTQYQSMSIADTGPYGRALFLDGKVQTTVGDERHYHEPLVHPPALFFRGGTPRTFLILGGADGGAVREALRWRSAQAVTLVDIDGEVVHACQEHLHEIHCGALQDARVRVVIDDAANFIAEEVAGRASYDVVICDLTDPMENSPSLGLFTVEFFESLKRLLSGDGAYISIQAGPTSLVENPTLYPRICATLKACFACVLPYQIYAPTYGSPLGMALATASRARMPTATQIDETFARGLNSELEILDGASFLAHFGIPRYLRKAVEAETRAYRRNDKAGGYGKGTLQAGV